MAEYNQIYQLTEDKTTDWELKTKDSFTVIHLGPDHPPIIKTIYDTVPCTIAGTPTMAISRDGRYALIANHSWRLGKMEKLQLPDGPQTNADLTPELIRQPKMTAQHVNMLSLIDLSTPEYRVVDRVLFDDRPMHVLAHPMGIALSPVATRISTCTASRTASWSNLAGTLNPWTGLFLDTPEGTPADRHPGRSGEWLPATVQWYSIRGNRIEHLSQVKVAPGVPTELLGSSFILRISPDGKQALICQRSLGNGIDHSDILFADLMQEKPVINAVIKQVSDGSESFAFHPNGKMAVATALGPITTASS